jgi:hypothetical protein
VDIQVTWHQPIRLHDGSDQNFIYCCNDADFENLPKTAGVYIFARRFGKTVSPLYIGQATRLKIRLKQQFNNTRLMKGIERATLGHRILIIGEIQLRPGQKAPQVLNVVESALIEHALANGHDLLNKQGTKTPVHVIRSSSGNLASRQVAPLIMYVRRHS